jgi:hypothetical protein
MKIENHLEAILASIQMECHVALGHVRNGDLRAARKIIDGIDMQCWHAFKHIDDYQDSIMEAQDRAHINQDIPW